jgi:hypothetical protein
MPLLYPITETGSGYVNVVKEKLLESSTLAQQAANNTKEQFASSPDLQTEITNASIDALEAHMLMSKQALDSEAVQDGIKDILLNHAQLWEALRSKRSPCPARVPTLSQKFRSRKSGFAVIYLKL